MRMILRRGRKKKNKILVIISIFIFISILSFSFISYFSKKALPLIMTYASAETKKLIILVINKAVTKQINNVDISDIFEVTYNNDGEVILIDFNSKRTSFALSTITSLVELNLRAIEEGKIDMLELPDNSLDAFDKDLLDKGVILEVPIGVISNSTMLANLGPKIPVKLSIVGDVSSGFSTEVEEYGINNALIKLYIDVEVNARVIMPFISEDISIKSSIPIAMKVIQGKIPEYYLNGFTTKSNIVTPN
jgi:sporulation protein YunB